MGARFSLGIYEKAFPHRFDWKTKCKIANEIGFDFIEMSIDESDERLARLQWDEQQCVAFKALQHTYSIPVSTICLSGLRRYPLGATDAAIREKGLETLIECIHLASRLGIAVVQIAGYDVYGEESTAETLLTFRDQIGKALDVAKTCNVVLAIENMETAATDSMSKVMHYVSYYDNPFLQAYVDAGNLIAMGHDVTTELQLAKGHIAAFHIKDVLPNICRDVPFTCGIVDFDTVFEQIKQIGYKGMLLLEMWANSHSDPVEEISKAYSFINSKLRIAELM